MIDYYKRPEMKYRGYTPQSSWMALAIAIIVVVLLLLTSCGGSDWRAEATERGYRDCQITLISCLGKEYHIIKAKDFSRVNATTIRFKNKDGFEIYYSGDWRLEYR